jgi:hypothetical protein
MPKNQLLKHLNNRKKMFEKYLRSLKPEGNSRPALNKLRAERAGRQKSEVGPKN